MSKSLKVSKFHLGACYYPEHWSESLWDDDFARMRDLGFSVVRVAEFAWSIFEPAEGKFEFELFDRALDAAERHGIKVILGTPTSTPPAWLTHRYPEVLNVAHNGVQYQHGQRRHYNYNAPIYQELSKRIARQMAEHYRDHPAVIGWQIDNELNCEVNVFYSEADHVAFRRWLQEKYGTLDTLNESWGAVFWNQTYTDWEQVHLTRPTPSDSPNPHQALDEKRFYSDSAISFAKMQADIIRETCPQHFVTTNGLFGHLDSHEMTDECLDFVSYDSYPNFSTIYPDKGVDPLLDRKWSWNLSVARDISPNFCVMEQQSGPGGWVNRMEQPSPKPGQMRLWTYQSIAHGADMLLYFRWRTATVGTEIYWHGINDYHNQPNRRVAEAAQIGRELGTVGESIVGSQYQADAAIVKDYDNEWDGELDKWHGDFEWTSISEWYKAFQYNHIPVDALFLRDTTKLQDLKKYKVLVYPHPTILSDATAKLLDSYVQSGGQVVFGARTGYKNESGHCEMRPFPGVAADLCGIEVEDFTLIGPYQQAPTIEWSGKSSDPKLTANAFNDILHVTSSSAEVLATYSSGYYSGKPVLVKNRVGTGAAYYYGAVFDQAVATSLLDELGLSSPVSDWLQLPKCVELSIRRDTQNDKGFIFLLNYSEEAQVIRAQRQVTDMFTNHTVSGEFTIEPFGVLLLQD